MNEVQAQSGSTDNDIYANPPDITGLELEPCHPGLGDAGYMRAVRSFRAVPGAPAARAGAAADRLHRRRERIRREVSPQLDALHRRFASRIYLKAKDDLGISANEIPQLRAPERAPRTRERDAPGAGRRLHSIPDVLFVHRRARVPGHAVHPARLQTGVHAGARHDSRLPGTRPAARESRLRGAADADGQGRRLGRHRRPGAGTQAPELVLDRVRPHRGRRRDQVFGAGIQSSIGEIPFSLSRTSNAGPSSPTR